VYIAQPPLYRAKRGKGETYIKDDRDLETFLIRRAAEARQVAVDGRTVSGDELVRRLHRLIAYRKHMQIVERRGHPRDIVEQLLARDVRDKSLFADRGQLEAFADAITTKDRSVAILADEEHNLFQLHIEDRSSGYPRRHALTADFLATGEYRALLGYSDVREYLSGPFRVSIVQDAPAETDAESVEETQAAAEGGPVETRPRARAREEMVTLDSIDALVEYFIAAGKKGVAINRYKGLGEMNPEQLWATTMKPEERTLLQVKAEDHAEADLMFTTLMGDQVEPRRRFIEDNALDVKNLDV
jgi:DNA gyrase subunit B